MKVFLRILLKVFKRFLLTVLIICALVCALAAIYCCSDLRYRHYETIPSPDGKMELEIATDTIFWSTPGGGGDVPCLLKLRNMDTGRVVFKGIWPARNWLSNVHFGTNYVSLDNIDGILFSGEVYGEWGGLHVDDCVPRPDP